MKRVQMKCFHHSILKAEFHPLKEFAKDMLDLKSKMKLMYKPGLQVSNGIKFYRAWDLFLFHVTAFTNMLCVYA